jgi:transposase
VSSDPDVLSKWFDRHCTVIAQVVLETGPLSTFRYHGLKERDVPVDCNCARNAKGVLANLELDPETPTPFRQAAIMKARTDRYQTLSDDLDDNHLDREKE